MVILVAPPEEDSEESTAAGKDVGNGWLRFWDPAESDHYYYHPDTEETSWDPPTHLLFEQGRDDDDGAGDNGGVNQEDSSSSSSNSRGHDDAAAQDGSGADRSGGGVGDGEDGADIGRGWKKFWSEEEQAYYFHHEETETTTWDQPPGTAGAEISRPEWAEKFGGKAYPEDAFRNAAAPPDGNGGYVGVDDEYEAQWRKPRQPKRAQVLKSTVYPDGYDWDAYARLYKIPSGWDAYAQHYGVSPADCAAMAAQAQAAAAQPGSLIYDGKPQEEDAMSRLERILGGKVGDAGGPAAATDVGMTEAQKIFGTDTTFTKTLVHRGAMEAAAKKAGFDLAELEEEQAAAGPARMIVPHPTDVQRLGYETAKQHAEMMALAQPPAAGGAPGGAYAQTATFNKRTGRFEGQGQVVRMGVHDDRRQTSHLFDYEKWTAEKAKGGKRGGTGPPPPRKKPKIGLGI